MPVKYGSDYQAARRILQEIAVDVLGDYVPSAAKHWEHMVSKFAIEDCRVDPMVTLIANGNWVELTLRYVVDPKRRRLTKDALFTRILEAFEKEGSGVAIAVDDRPPGADADPGRARDPEQAGGLSPSLTSLFPPNAVFRREAVLGPIRRACEGLARPRPVRGARDRSAFWPQTRQGASCQCIVPPFAGDEARG